MSLLRCSGVVRAVGERAWSSADGKRTGTIRWAIVETAPFADVELSLGDADRFGEGEVVDLAVDVSVDRRFLRIRPKGAWRADLAVAEPAKPLAAVKS
jgi:hypothetical protein